MRWLRRIILIVVTAWAVFVLIGLIPVNLGFESAADGIEIFVSSNAVHAEILVPVRTEFVDWTRLFPSQSFKSDTQRMTHVAVGWGDREFFVNTPEWSDLTAGTALSAMFLPSKACVHATMTQPERYTGLRSVKIVPEQYGRLIQYVRASLRLTEDGESIPLTEAGYGPYDAFFEAHGIYCFFNTCNSWLGRALKKAGVRVALSTSLPHTVFLWWPE